MQYLLHIGIRDDVGNERLLDIIAICVHVLVQYEIWPTKVNINKTSKYPTAVKGQSTCVKNQTTRYLLQFILYRAGDLLLRLKDFIQR